MDHRWTYELEFTRLSFPLTLDFEVFQVAVIFVAVVMTNYLIMDGKSNWMEGVMLLGVYTIVAISYWLYPDPDDSR
jgi:Ca2+:H+ antiporter